MTIAPEGRKMLRLGVARDDLPDGGAWLYAETVERWVKPEEFVELKAEADELGFADVMSGPLVRSSYRAGTLYKQAIAARFEASCP
jgi:lipoate synthase